MLSGMVKRTQFLGVTLEAPLLTSAGTFAAFLGQNQILM